MNFRRPAKWLRSRPEMIAFALGALLFAGGAAKLVFDQGRAVTSTHSRPGLVPVADTRARVGPAPGESIASYLDRKKKLLAERASKGSRVSSFAVVSFDRYRKSEETVELLGANKLSVASIWIRVPLPGFDPVEVKSGDGFAAAVAAETKRIEKEKKQELDDLEAIIPTVTDPAFRKVYQEDAQRLRKAVDLLESEPSVVFAMVVRATNASLSKAAGSPGVRLVDVADDPNASPDTHRFSGILPEET